MTEKELANGMWENLNPSTEDQLLALEEESYKEAKSIYNEQPSKAKELLKTLVLDLDIRKIPKDMYVWERINAIKKGIERAEEQEREQG